ncbi:MAG: sporulation protein YabP [Oscillospiraceae bacterium]
MQEKDKAIKMPHNIILEDRKVLSISGVNDIDSFDDKLVILFTEQGELTIKGNNLHINKLNVDTGELTMDGDIIAIFYNDDKPKKNNKFMSKVFQ